MCDRETRQRKAFLDQEVFDEYEKQIEDLEAKVEKLQDENARLRARASEANRKESHE